MLGGAAHDRGLSHASSLRRARGRRGVLRPRRARRSAVSAVLAAVRGRRHQAAVRLRAGDRGGRLGRVRGRLRPRRRQGPDPAADQPPVRGAGATATRCRSCSSTARTAATRASPCQPRRRLRLRCRRSSGRRRAHSAAPRPRAPGARHARPSAARAPTCPARLDNYYVPRGYAVVLGESIGTFNSQGCPDVGADAETLGTKAAIDWLNGRARGFDDAGNAVTADWTTGDVGMTGVSYNGTLPNQVATTGVEGLKTIVPDLGDLLLVRLLPRQRPRGRAALQHQRRRRERLPRRGHRRARRLHRRPADGGRRTGRAATCTTTCSPSRTA